MGAHGQLGDGTNDSEDRLSAFSGPLLSMIAISARHSFRNQQYKLDLISTTGIVMRGGSSFLCTGAKFRSYLAFRKETRATFMSNTFKLVFWCSTTAVEAVHKMSTQPVPIRKYLFIVWLHAVRPWGTNLISRSSRIHLLVVSSCKIVTYDAWQSISVIMSELLRSPRYVSIFIICLYSLNTLGL